MIDFTDQTNAQLIERLHYQTTPGVHSVICGSDCGHESRGGWACAECVDAELLRRGVDLTKGGSCYAYERVGGRIRRKLKGANG